MISIIQTIVRKKEINKNLALKKSCISTEYINVTDFQVQYTESISLQPKHTT